MSRLSSSSAPIPVLLYHRIADRKDDLFTVPLELFAEHVDVILASGRTPLTLGELADGLRGKSLLPGAPGRDHVRRRLRGHVDDRLLSERS